MNRRACTTAAVFFGVAVGTCFASLAISQDASGGQSASSNSASPGAAAAGQPAPSPDLAKKVEDLEKAVNELKAQKTAGPTVVMPAWVKDLKITLGGFVQLNGEFGDAASFEGRLKDGLPRSSNNEIESRFRLRRARINVTGDLPFDFDFKLEGDFGQSDGVTTNRASFSGTDIFFNSHMIPEANLKGGQYKAPFGLEQLTPDTLLFIIERSLPTGAITPERQVGVQLWGNPLTHLGRDSSDTYFKDLFKYYAGIFNGNGRNTVVNDNPDFMYVGRAEVVPFAGKIGGMDWKLKIGGDALYTQDEIGTTLSQAGNLRLNADGSLTSFTWNKPDERFGWGVDASLNIGPFDLIAEYLEERIRPTAAGALLPAATFAPTATFNPRGYYVQPSFFLPIGEKNPIGEQKTWQVAARWESFNPDQAQHDDIKSITAGINYYIAGDNLKIMVDYIHTWSDFRDHNPGHGPVEFNEILVRTQLMF